MSGDRLREAAQEVADELEFAGVARFDAGALAAQLREAIAADERGDGERLCGIALATGHRCNDTAGHVTPYHSWFEWRPAAEAKP